MKYLFLVFVLMLVVLSPLTASVYNVPWMYMQRLVNASNHGELPGVFNTDVSMADGYTLEAINIRTNAIISSTTDSVKHIRLYRAGNGTSVPFFTCAFINLSSQFYHSMLGDTLRCTVANQDLGIHNTWDVVLPNRYVTFGYGQAYNPVIQVECGAVSIPDANLLSPANQAQAVSVRPTLTWMAVEEADEYEIYIGTDEPLLVTSVNASTTSYNLSNDLQYLTTYFWYVKAVKHLPSFDTSSHSQTWQFTTIQNEQDFLGLISLYNSCGGSAWNNNSNWLSVSPINTWYGVTVNDGRVVAINLEGNNVIGELPASIGNIAKLQSLRLTNNFISGLPSMVSNILLGELHVSGNKLTFEDIEPLLGLNLPSLIYAPQRPVFDVETVTVLEHSPCTLSSSIGGSSNSYQWYKNGVPYSNVHTFMINDILQTDAGIYSCMINNFLVPGLTIQRSPITISVVLTNDSPTINLPISISLNQNESATLDFSTYATDPDGDNLSLSVSDNNQIGVQIQGFSVTISSTNNWTGSETLTFTVDDGVVERHSRATASDIVSIVVTNPLLVDFSTDSQLNNNVVAGDPQTAISFSASANLTLTSFAWDFDNDGTTDSTLPTPSYTYPDTGMVSVKLTASDGVHVATVIKQDYIHVHPGVVVPPAVVNQNIVWTEEGGPYNLTGEVLLNPGYSLTIEPNAQVNMLVDNHLVINGSINATGANFTAFGENGWGGIVLGSTATNSVINGINVVGAATGITINDCNPVLTGITLVAAESQRTPTQAIVINGASAPQISNLTINNFAYGIKANNPGTNPVNLNINSLRVNRGTPTPASGDTAFEINGNYIVDISSTIISEYPYGIKIDSSNRSRARARLTNTRVIKTESNNRDNSIAFNLTNLSQVELVRDSLSGFNTGIFISNPQLALTNITMLTNTITRSLNQMGSEVGIKLLGNSAGTIDSTFVHNYNRAMDFSGNHALQITNNKFVDCSTVLSESQNHSPHSLVRNLAYRSSIFTGAVQLPIFSIDAGTNFTAKNNTFHAFPSYVSATNASSLVFNQNIIWSPNPGSTPISLSGGSTLNASYCDIALAQGVQPGTGNLNTNPLFMNPAQGIFALNVYSPCIDAGNPANPHDPDGSIADMGAFTFNWATAPLIADFFVDTSSGQHPLTVHFTDHSTRNTISREWDFNADNITDSTEQNPVWTYTATGTYSVKLRVFDGVRYDTKLLSNLIQALNTPPQITQTIPSLNIPEDSPGSIIELANYFHDANNDPLSFSFTQSNQVVNASLNGSQLSISTIPNINGSCQITVSALEISRTTGRASSRQRESADGNRESSRVSQSFTITVQAVNDAPTISLPSSFTFAEDANLVVNMASLVSDVDSPNLTITAQNSAHVSVAMNGLVATLTSTANWFGTENLSFTVSDGSLTASASTNVIVTPVNDPPTISLPASFTFAEDGSISINMANYASDVDSATLTLTASGNTHVSVSINGMMVSLGAEADWSGTEAITFTVNDNVSRDCLTERATDNGQSRLIASATTNIIVSPVNEAPSITLPSSFTFAEDANLVVNMASLVSDVDSPNLTITAQNSAHVSVTMNGLVATLTTTANWFGTENLNFTVSDGSLTASASTNVIVTPVNDPPTMSLPSSYTFAEDANLVVNMASLVDDVDSSNLTITAQNSAHVSVTMNGLVATLTTTANWFGTENLNFTVSDGSLTASASTNVIVTPVNDPPTISLPASFTFAEDANLVVNMASLVDDVDSSNLTITAQNSAHVSVTMNGLVATLTSTANWFGTENLSFTVSDGSLTASASTSVEVTTENDAPSISLLPLYQFMEDETLMLDLSDCISDVDSQDLSLAVSGNGFTHCTVDGYTLLFSADPNWFGSEQLTVTVSDSRTRLSSSTITTILVEPVNDPPQIVSYNPATSEIEALANSSVSFSVEATDIDSQLSYHWFVNGEELSDSSSSCSYFFSQSGTYAVSVKVADEGVELMHEWSVLVPVGVDDPELCPTTTQLYPIYPNPFSEQSTISFSLKEAAYTTIQVYNAKGQLIKTLCDSQQTAAQHKLCWDGKDDSGQSVASGVYYVRMQCFGDLYMVKALLIK